MIEWKNDGRTAIINGWWFHFEEMYAIRRAEAPRYFDRRKLVQKWVDSHEIGGVNEDDIHGNWSEVNYRRQCGHYGVNEYGQEVWFAFFTPPEDHYNDLIQEAYQIYLLEKALKDSNSDHNSC